MNLIMYGIDFILHLDKHLIEFVAVYGALVYVLLFLIVFLETGIVVMPFLPGDSLLFAAGALAAIGQMNVLLLIGLLIVAAILGDSTNYYLGNKFEMKFKKYIKKEHLKKTHNFYEKYGNKTIVIARFVPIVRTIAPFVAGVGEMNYKNFLKFNVIGAIVWVLIFVLLGFFFGNVPFVKDHFGFVIIAIIVISFVPILIEYIKHKRQKNAN